MTRCILATLVLIMAPWPGLACIEPIAVLPDGPARAVDLEGDLAVFSSGRVLVVVDLSDASHPTELGRVVLREGIRAVDLVGDHAYAALGKSGLSVIDLSDPAAPVVVGSIVSEAPGESVEAVDVVVVEPFAFVGEYVRGGEFQLARLHVIDVSEPSRPFSVSSIHRMGTTKAIAAADNLVFLGVHSGVRVYDVSDFEQPVELSSMGLWGRDVADVEVVENSVFVVDDWDAHLTTYDLTDPESPQLVSDLQLENRDTYGLAVHDGYAFVASGREGLLVVDVSDLESPVVAGSLDVPGTAFGVAAGTGLAVVAANGGGLRIVEMANPSRPTEIGAVNTPGSADYISMAGDLAVVSSRWPGDARLIDISDPTSPAELGILPVVPQSGRIAIEGSYAYALVGSEDGRGPGLSVIAITDPLVPVEVGFAPIYFWPYAIAVQGPNAYVVGNSVSFSGLWVFDVRIPWTPLHVGSLSLSGNPPSSITVAGDYAYVGRHPCPWAWPGCYSSLQVVDISNPSNPSELGFAGAPRPNSPVYRDGFVFGMTGSGLEVFDCRNPAAPELAFLENTHAAYLDQGGQSMTLGDGMAFTTTYQPWRDPFTAALHIWDIRNPAWPRKIARHETPGQGRDVGVSGDHVFVADGDAGIAVFDVGNCGGPVSRRSGGRVQPQRP